MIVMGFFFFFFSSYLLMNQLLDKVHLLKTFHQDCSENWGPRLYLCLYPVEKWGWKQEMLSISHAFCCLPSRCFLAARVPSPLGGDWVILSSRPFYEQDTAVPDKQNKLVNDIKSKGLRIIASCQSLKKVSITLYILFSSTLATLYVWLLTV